MILAVHYATSTKLVEEVQSNHLADEFTQLSLKSMAKLPKSPCEQSLFQQVADGSVQDEMWLMDAENSVWAEVIEYLKLVKVPSYHWLHCTDIEKGCSDQSMVYPNIFVNFDLRSAPQLSLKLTECKMSSINAGINILVSLTSGCYHRSQVLEAVDFF